MKVRNQKGFTLIELLIVVAIIGIIAAIAIPGLLRARQSGNEASAIGSMRAIGSAQASYSSGGSQGGYADRLATLALPCSATGQGFISTDLSTDPSQKSGYQVDLIAGGGAGAVALTALDCTGKTAFSAFYATATPLSLGTSGSRGFATDAGGSVWQDTSGAAPAQPFTLGGTISPIQ